MTVEITIQVPDQLGKQLQQLQERLPEVLERGLHEILAEEAGAFPDESAIIEVLTSQPKPEQVLTIHASPALQARVSELLERSHQGELSTSEATELERYMLLEHMVRLAKGHAYRQLAHRQ